MFNGTSAVRALVGLLVILVLIFVAGGVSAAQTAPAARSLITAPVDDSARTVLKQSRHPLAKPEFDAGPVNKALPMQRMVLVLGAPAEQEQQLNQFLSSQHDKRSQNYHQWLTPQDFAARFGPSPNDVQKVRSWLESKGFAVGNIARGGRWIEFSGTAVQVESAFQTQMRNYQVNGSAHIANATDISLPSALSPVVRGVLSLHNFFSRPTHTSHYGVHRNSNGAWVPVGPDFTYNPGFGVFHFLTPNDYVNIYNLAPLYQSGVDGSGQTLAIVARANVSMADVEIFRRVFALPDNDPHVVLNGPDLSFFSFGDAIEATLDVEWAGAVAPRATVDLVVSGSTATTDGVDLSAAYIVDNNLASVMSVSFGLCEQQLLGSNAFYNALWQQASAQGISVFVSSGDNGAAGCDDPGFAPATGGLGVNGLASTPFNTAVGGTQFAENGNDAGFWNAINGLGFASANGYIPEAVWNESCDLTDPNCGFPNLFAGSGGSSTLYAVPSWQTLSIPGLNSLTNRSLPDVSLAAAAGHDGYLLCVIGFCDTSTDGNDLTDAAVVGGTSASAPSMAGIMTLINQKLGGRQGLANYGLYRIAASQDFSQCNSSARTNPATPSTCPFNDITAGNNSVPGQTGFNAAAGYDRATGLGSVNAANLANAWSALVMRGSATILTATPPVNVAHGTPISLAIGVAPSDAVPGTPAGSVSLVSSLYGPVAVAPLTSGGFSGSFNSLPGGQYNLTAHFPGDGTFGPSDSTPVPVNISAESSSLAITAYTNGQLLNGPIVFGQFLELRGTVTGGSLHGVATGTVTFSDFFNGATTQLGSATLNSEGYAELVSFGFFNEPANLAVGTHFISAAYSGDGSFNSSVTPSPLVVTVTKGISFALLEANPLSVTSTQQVLLHAFAFGSADGVQVPTGSMQFFDNGSPLGPPVVMPPPPPGELPQVSTQLSLPVGTHTVMVQYLGDGNYDPSPTTPDDFNSQIVTVSAATGNATQTTLIAANDNPIVAQLVNYTIKVSSAQTSPPLTGTVELFSDDLGQLTAPLPLQNGQAVVTFQWPLGGTHKFLAQYSGDANYAASGSNILTANVGKSSPSISLTASAQNAASGTQESLFATVFSPPPPLVFGFFLPNGPVQFFDALNGGQPQPLGPQTNLTPLNFFETVTDGYQALAALATGLPDGNHVITAQYLGDISSNPANSNAVNIQVGPRTSTKTSLAVDIAKPALGQTVTFTANITPSQGGPALTGSIQLINHSRGILGTGTVSNGSAIIPIQWNLGGVVPVIAVYSGDNTYASSSSNPVGVTVPTFELFPSTNTLPLQAGQSGAVGITLDPIAGFNSPTTFTCGAGIPAGSTCSFTTPTITPNGGPATTFLVVSTTAPSSTVGAAKLTARNPNPWWGLSAAAGVAGLFLIALPGRRGRKRMALMLMMFCIVAFAIGCGGGGPTGGPTPTPTPPPTPTPTPSPSTTTSLVSSGTKVALGDTVTFTATVVSTIGKPLTGTVTFLDGTATLGPAVSVTGGKAQLTLNTLSVGTHSVTAHYNGDSQNDPSTSSVVHQAVTGMVTFQFTASGGTQTKTVSMNVVIE